MPSRNFFKAEKSRGKHARQIKKGYQPAKKIEEHWDFFGKNIYVAKARSGMPPWLLPLVALLLIATLVFWGAPTLITRLQAYLNLDIGQETQPVDLLYGDDVWTVTTPVANVFDRDDIKAGRVTQALFNEPVWITSQDCALGFVKVRLTDGCEGYMRNDDLIDSRQSIEPELYKFKLVIAETTKRILSHARQGTLLIEVPMGTVLFADYRGNGISRVVLPDGQEGWLSDSGIIILPSTGKIEPVTDGARYFSSTALAFNQITHLPNGQSVYGISTVGIARLAAMTNGIALPRLLADQAASGSPVILEFDETTGLPDISVIRPGDLLFLSGRQDEAGTPSDLAICVAAGQVLYAHSGQTSIRLVDLTLDQDLQKRILFVKRLFG